MVENVVIMISQDFISYFYFYLGGGGREYEDKRRQTFSVILAFYFIFLKTTFFLGRTSKELAHLFFGTWTFLLVHIWFTPSEGPKDFVT